MFSRADTPLWCLAHTIGEEMGKLQHQEQLESDKDLVNFQFK